MDLIITSATIIAAYIFSSIVALSYLEANDGGGRISKAFHGTFALAIFVGGPLTVIVLVVFAICGIIVAVLFRIVDRGIDVFTVMVEKYLDFTVDIAG